MRIVSCTMCGHTISARQYGRPPKYCDSCRIEGERFLKRQRWRRLYGKKYKIGAVPMGRPRIRDDATSYLLRSPANAKALYAAIANADAGRTVARDDF